MTLDYSPKLKAIRAEIEALLKRHDVAGVVVLHDWPRTGDGFAEVFYALSPSYSKLTGIPPQVRIRSLLADYGGNVDAQRDDLAATANMVSLLGTTTGRVSLSLLELATMLEAKTGAHHGELRFRPDNADS